MAFGIGGSVGPFWGSIRLSGRSKPLGPVGTTVAVAVFALAFWPITLTLLAIWGGYKLWKLWKSPEMADTRAQVSEMRSAHQQAKEMFPYKRNWIGENSKYNWQQGKARREWLSGVRT